MRISAVGLVSLACLLFSNPIAASALTRLDPASRQNPNQDLNQEQKQPGKLGKLAQVPLPQPTVRMIRLSGSKERGETIANPEKSLACTLQEWQLIGVFRDEQIVQTKGELTFEITNNSDRKQRFALGELLFLNDQKRALTVSNPHRRLQGQFLDLKPVLEPGETRTYTENIWYESGWDEVKLKTCRWLEQGKDYWKIYPELKPDAQSAN